MFGNDRRNIREHFLSVWRKMQARTPLEPLEAIIAEVIDAHPEYHSLFDAGDALLDADWTPEDGQTNPFLHMGLHIALREQVESDRPPGIRATFDALCRQTGNMQEAEHIGIECLAQALWASGRSGMPPDEDAYLACIRAKLRVRR